MTEEYRIPDDRRYTEDHEWAMRLEDGRIRVGITDYAQDQLGDVVYAELPSLDKDVAKGETVAEVESTKSVAEVYAPVSGRVVAINEALVAAPELVNADPYGDGWFVEIEPSDPTQYDELLDADAYRALLD